MRNGLKSFQNLNYLDLNFDVESAVTFLVKIRGRTFDNYKNFDKEGYFVEKMRKFYDKLEQSEKYK